MRTKGQRQIVRNCISDRDRTIPSVLVLFVVSLRVEPVLATLLQALPASLALLSAPAARPRPYLARV